MTPIHVVARLWQGGSWNDAICAWSTADRTVVLAVGHGAGGGDLHCAGDHVASLVVDTVGELLEQAFDGACRWPDSAAVMDRTQRESDYAGGDETELLAELERCAGSPAERLERAFVVASERVRRRGPRSVLWEHVSAEAVAVHASEDLWSIVHAGGTRALLWRDGALTRLTTDHCLGEEARAAGKLPDFDLDDPLDDPMLAASTSILGGDARHLQIQRVAIPRRPGDVVLLLTPPLRVVARANLVAALASSPDHDACARALLDGIRDDSPAVALIVDPPV